MDRFQRYGNLLRNDGTNQLQRLPPALEPDYIVPDERSLVDLLTYAYHLAADIRFIALTGQATGDWRPFLESLVLDPATGRPYDSPALEHLLQSRRDWPPHLTLFVVFLQLFHHLQTDLNELPQRHLRHYYERQLQLLRRPAQADEVHVIFELAKMASPTLVPAHTPLEAGKDSQGRPRIYQTQSDLVVNGAQISGIRRLVGQRDRRREQRFFVAEGISDQEGESWYTFGRSQLDLDPSQRFMSEAQMGFAIASPILLLAESDRTITLDAQLSHRGPSQPPMQGLDAAFTVEVTGAEGWLTPTTVRARLQPAPPLPLTLALTITLPASAPAIVPFDPELHGDGPGVTWPLLRCRLTPGYYQRLQGLTVDRATLGVNVLGVKNLVVQNSQGKLTPDQPMALFGRQPRLGSPFYIGSTEVLGKRLTSLALNLSWDNIPDGDALFEHYQAYFDEGENGLSAAQFRGRFFTFVDLLYGGTWHSLLPSRRSLFEAASDRRLVVTPSNISALANRLGPGAYQPQPQLPPVTAYRVDSRFGFIRLTLQGPTRADTGTAFEAFGHQLFPIRYAHQAIALSRWSGDPALGPALPNEPITPLLASLSLDYSATATLVPGATTQGETWFSLQPFGYSTATSPRTATLVPDLEERSPTDPGDGDLGILYIGLKGVTSPANLSLLFAIDQGTAGTEPLLPPHATEWSYLSGDTWMVLPPTAILSDSTYGFQEPGIVVLALGAGASTDHTAMPPGQVWLRARIRQTPASAARTHALYTQAVQARFSPPGEDLSSHDDHLQGGLAAQTIQRQQQRTPGIKAVQQPYQSFQGRARESDLHFFQRCSERLRHRQRAVTPWDFERLVLEAFPQVFKVKCLPHCHSTGEPWAGHVALVILPDVRNLEHSNPLEPKAGAVLMGRIRDYVTGNLATAFAQIHVIHPVYERLRVDARVAFRPGLDAGYYTAVLNQDLQRFLSPWAYAEGEDITFGGQVYRSEILAFMEGRPYVDYVTQFSLYHSHRGPQQGGVGDMVIGRDFFIRPAPKPVIGASPTGMVVGDTLVVGQGIEVAAATRPHSILVSHQSHRILPLQAPTCDGINRLGIGYMTVRLDFEVSAP
jgi:hypothetical protein